ncbi:alpha/beta hydrolase [Vagococcus sp. BWB3-3]|uniref:Alpha/beta hydrolase n=1 Tax=Vagococcus allomyrinae TaxID=2794353 RepID=A0A940PEE2_9ENTE|nr:alpha/beta hydrolase [Vagococcus allomyrinae]MBP1044506.1 alpha/beta hydrolase [Vagococcus allomyrinae]
MVKKIGIFVGIVLLLSIIVGLGWGVNYLFDYAIVRGEKEFLSASEASGSQGSDFSNWSFVEEEPTTVTQTSFDKLKLVATHFKQEQKGIPKLAILSHGYGSDAEHMQDFGELFYEMGYDLLVPDARAHGQSEGEYIGFGWPDRLDYVEWIKLMVNRYPEGVDIMLFGISMGGATVMMTSGEDLPDNVKVIIEDCGYDTVANELSYQLKDMFNLPSFPLIPLTSVYSGIKAGYNFNEASSVAQLNKNSLPMLFIHGDADKFVPFEMLESNYNATQGPKEKYVGRGSKHGTSFKDDREGYTKAVKTFLDKYMN